jgi:hypothetical protein
MKAFIERSLRTTGQNLKLIVNCTIYQQYKKYLNIHQDDQAPHRVYKRRALYFQNFIIFVGLVLAILNLYCMNPIGIIIAKQN